MRYIFLAVFAGLTVLVSAQNVGIGTTTPHSSALLDMQSTSKGVLVPRVALSALNSSSPVTAPADALLIFNTATAGSGINAVRPGFYYWRASDSRWIAATDNGKGEDIGYGPWGEVDAPAKIGGFAPVSPSAPESYDHFGQSVSISGNYAIIGAYSDDNGMNTDQGAAYIFFFNGETWKEQQKLRASDGKPLDFFGSGVAISGDYAIVGAKQARVNGNAHQGAAYIYHYNGSSWIEQQKLLASDGAAEDFFGISVDISSSLSGNYAIVGAYLHNTAGITDRGAAYIYSLNGSNWLFQQQIVASNGAVADLFGYSVSISGSKAMVGAPLANIDGYEDCGYAYIYSFNGIVWKEQQILHSVFIGSLNGLTSDHFGSSVCIADSYAIAGGDWINKEKGSALVFLFDGTSWNQMTRILPTDLTAGDHFGSSVAIAGNFLIVGAVTRDVGTNVDQGAAYIYQNMSGTWTLLQKITIPSGKPGDMFGISSGINAGRFVIGAIGRPSAQEGMSFFGKIY